ncbi:MAG: methyltransferase domain-containing protein [Planctomycetales bacterium]|nr:methyltransferase domain-containing protein [Planctomycetales bacterium]
MGIVYRGYDMTASFRDTCRARWPGGDFRLGDAAALPEPDAGWDVVFCRHLLEHVEDWRAALAELARVAGRWLVVLSWRALTDKAGYQTDPDVTTWVFNRAEFTGALGALGEVETINVTGAAPIYVVKIDGAS